jgi:3-oxoacyl-[acyl-carrier-protein] synthase II
MCIGAAFELIREGQADVMVAGGSEATACPLGMSGFAAMKALSTRNDDPPRASRPFDRDRDGFVLGEGAGIVILEEMENAKKRGAHIRGEILSYGMSCDAYHLTAPAPQGAGAARAMRLAISRAGIQPNDIDYINAHGTSTLHGDICEVQAIKQVFGEHANSLVINSNKSQIGHLLGAAGGVELASCLKTLETGIVPPTINLENIDPACEGLDFTPNTAREHKVKKLLNNSFGFGGHNACLAVGKFEG